LSPVIDGRSAVLRLDTYNSRLRVQE